MSPASKKKGGKVNRAWLHDHLTDPYVKLAQREGYRARAAYKLMQLDEALGLVRPGKLIRYVDGATTRIGLVRGMSADAGPEVSWQNLEVETHV